MEPIKIGYETWGQWGAQMLAHAIQVAEEPGGSDTAHVTAEIDQACQHAIWCLLVCGAEWVGGDMSSAC